MRVHLKKIFDENIGYGKISLALIGLVLGFAIVMISSELFFKVQTILGDTKDANYLMLNKKVSLLGNTLFNSTPGFNEEEITALKSQDFIEKVTPVTSAKYKVTLREKTVGIRTDLFFESVPDDYLDVRPSDFRWSEGDHLVPVILPREFLHLLNFGFGQSQGIPPISPSVLQSLTFDLRFKNKNNDEIWTKGRIVGLSDRITTFLVPQSFNEYMNQKLVPDQAISKATRLLASVTNPSEPALIEYLKQNRIETNQDKLNSGKVALIVKTLLSILLFFGVFFIVLSVMILLLVLELIVTKARNNVQLLLQLGFTTGHLRSYFFKYVMMILSIEIILALAIFFGVNTYINYELTEMGYVTPTIFLATIAVAIVFIVINIGVFWKSLSKIFKEYH